MAVVKRATEYLNTVRGTHHDVYLMEAASGRIVATPADLWRFYASDEAEVRRKAAAKGEDPEEAVRRMPPPSVWLKRPLSTDGALRGGGRWRENAVKGRNRAAVDADGRKVGQWFDDYADDETGQPLQAKLWLRPSGGSSYVVPCDERGRALTVNDVAPRVTVAGLPARK